LVELQPPRKRLLAHIDSFQNLVTGRFGRGSEYPRIRMLSRLGYLRAVRIWKRSNSVTTGSMKPRMILQNSGEL
jgi:hypothetical protein